MREIRRAVVACALVTAVSLSARLHPAGAQGMTMPMASASPAQSDRPAPNEAAFIGHVARVLLTRYPTVAQAEKGGYKQTTGIDEDGTAIYFNGDFSRVDALHPNFLWYDRAGKLVGLDYELPQSAYPSPPTLGYPVAPSRWTVVREHVHFAYRVGDGPIHMHGARAYPNLRTDHITAAELTADHLLPDGSTLVWAYHHPACWDLGFWLIPNPDGSFAEKNPNVK